MSIYNISIRDQYSTGEKDYGLYHCLDGGVYDWNYTQDGLEGDMSIFNQFGNIEDPKLKRFRNGIESLVTKQLDRLVAEGASVVELRAVIQAITDSVDNSGAAVIIKKQLLDRKKS